MPSRITRRQVTRILAAAAPASLALAATRRVTAAQRSSAADSAGPPNPLPADLLPAGVRSRFVDRVNGLRMHLLEAGHEDNSRPLVLLLHGFPELAYSWRKILVPLAEAGYHVVAPDQRGYGRTTGWDGDYDGDLASFRRLNVARDALGLVFALGHRSVAAVVGHDFGSPIAAWCVLTRPDVFRSVALMSGPFDGPPPVPFDTAATPPHEAPVARANLAEALAALSRPRKHYQQYYTTREANANMLGAPQGVHAFLRGYFHYKSADWPGNRPFRLAARTATEMARMPTYYIMNLEDGMAETVAPHMPSPDQVAANRWLPDRELRVYSDEFTRTGFQGGLNWYRSGSVGLPEQELFSGRAIEQPSTFIAGASDWGSYQNPGALERMQQAAVCKDFRGAHLVDGAGHWVQQEQPAETARLLLQFLRGLAA
ncbi:MAG: alpha/beta hydrolase [Thermoguttaceae bacterium]